MSENNIVIFCIIVMNKLMNTKSQVVRWNLQISEKPKDTDIYFCCIFGCTERDTAEKNARTFYAQLPKFV